MKMPIMTIPTLDFSFKDNRKVNLPGTVAGVARKIPAYRRGMRRVASARARAPAGCDRQFFRAAHGHFRVDLPHAVRRWSRSRISLCAGIRITCALQGCVCSSLA